jgi:hypothetical protein
MATPLRRRRADSAPPAANDATRPALARSGRPGRPPKFGRRARPITITLPEDLVERLKAQHLDIGRAIVELFEPTAERSQAPVQLAEFGHSALILVPPASALRRLEGLELIPLSNGRALIALDHPMSPSDLELALHDTLAAPDLPEADRAIVANVVDILREARTSARARLRQRTIVILERDPKARRRVRTP